MHTQGNAKKEQQATNKKKNKKQSKQNLHIYTQGLGKCQEGARGNKCRGQHREGGARRRDKGTHRSQN